MNVTLYVFDPATMKPVVEITGPDNETVERHAAEYYDMDRLSSTYAPAFDAVDGLRDVPIGHIMTLHFISRDNP